MSNWGHRLGSDVVDYPENSLAALKAATRLQKNKKFKFWELDIIECIESIRVFHDTKQGIKRMCGDHPCINQELKGLIDVQIDYLYLDGTCEKIPTLQQVFEIFNEHKITKDIRVEIKHIESKKAIMEITDALITFRLSNPKIKVYFAMRKPKYRKCFKDKEFKKFFLKHIASKNVKLKLTGWCW